MPDDSSDIRMASSKMMGWIQASDLPIDLDTVGRYPRALYLGGSGDITVEDFHGNVVTLTNAQAGSTLPISVRRITAMDMMYAVALF